MKSKMKIKMDFYMVLSLFIITTIIEVNCFNIRLNSLRTIISSQAAIRAFTSQVTNEIFNENILVSEFSRYQYDSHFDTFYVLLFTTSLYLHFKYTTNIDNKLKDLDTYNKVKKITNQCLLIFILIFTKNVENAI
jgi:hypothetical protein